MFASSDIDTASHTLEVYFVHNGDSAADILANVSGLPGTTINERILVTNNDAIEQSFSFELKPDPNSASAISPLEWISLPSSKRYLASGKSRSFNMSISLPEDIEPGEYRVNIDVTSQDVIIGTLPVLIDVIGEISFDVDWNSLEWTAKNYQSGDLKGNILNNSKVPIAGTVIIDISHQGELIETHTIEDITIGPHKNIDIWRQLELPSWFKDVQINATFEYSVSGVKAGLYDNNTIRSLVVVSNPYYATITRIGGLAGLLIVVLILFKIVRRQYFHHHKVNFNEDIDTICAHYKCNKKRLIKINNLSPPYTLIPGQSLKIPVTHEQHNEILKKISKSTEEPYNK